MKTMTKELLRSILLLATMMTVSLTFTACDDEDEDSNNSGSITTNYGVVTDTGVKTKSLFASAHNGDNVLTIPGFAPIRAEGYYNVYKHLVESMRLYSDDEGNEFAEWTPGTSLPSSFKKTSGYGFNGLVRTKVKNSEEYVYAYIERVRYLEESTGGMDGNVIGVVIKYKSPIDPLTFKGFE